MSKSLVDAIESELTKLGPSLYRRRNVVGFGPGTKAKKPCAVFYVRRKVPLSRLAAKDRLPRSIVVGRKRVATDVVAVGRVRFLAAAIGDMRPNDKSYRDGGQGKWEMGTNISVWTMCTQGKAPERVGSFWGATGLGGTSGALVLKQSSGKSVYPPVMLTCGHLLLKPGMDVAQCAEDRVPPCSGANVLKNFVGTVSDVAAITDADAGWVECDGAEPTILGIGNYKDYVSPQKGMYVQKSGAATGLTYSRIKEPVITSMKFETPYELKQYMGVTGDEVEMRGLFAIRNECKDDPANVPGKSPAAVDKFGASGDSGALVVVGNPLEHSYGVGKLQEEYEGADAAGKAKMDKEYWNASLGLLVAETDKLALGQDLTLALKALNVKLLTV